MFMDVILFKNVSFLKLFKDWSQFLFGSWRNNLNESGCTHWVTRVRKAVYNLIEVISNEPNK